MKRNINKIVAATLIASTFVACSDEIENGTYGTPYNANTSSIASAGTAVDLGLPSGTKWADKNVGATSAQDMGLSFIWGDVTGTQLSAAEDTYKLGAAADLNSLFNSFKGDLKETKGTIQLAKLEKVKVTPVDSIRPNYACDLLIERHANVKVKDADGNFIPDGKGDFVREARVYTEVKDLIVMANKPEEYGPALAEFLKPYVEDQYNNYVIVKSDSVFFTDVIQKIVPVGIRIDDIVAETATLYNKPDAKGYLTEAVYDPEDMLLYSDLIVEAESVSTYYEGKNGEVAAYSIIGSAEYDAATKNWGADWAMPTSAQLEELIKECTWVFEGNGYRVTGPSGSSIFLPAAGYRYESKQIGAGAAGYYASGEVKGNYTFPTEDEQKAKNNGSVTANPMANVLTFNYGQFDNSKRILNKFAEKNIGLSIRPVSKK